MEPRKNTLRSGMVSIGGLLMIVSSLVHFVNTGETIIAINTKLVSFDYGSTAMDTWIMSGLFMLVTGLWLLFLAPDIRAERKKAMIQVTLIGLILIVFGLGSWWQQKKLLYLLFFAIVGILLLLPVISFKRRQSN